jgi:hypothetical protein
LSSTPTLGLYLDSALDQPATADAIDGMIADVQALLDRTADPAPRPQSVAYAVSRGRIAGGRYGPKSLGDLLTALREGSLDQWSVTFTAGRTDSVAALSWHAVPADPAAAVQIALTVSPPVWTPEQVDAVAPELVALMAGWAGPLDLLYGAVTYDRVLPTPTPYERWFGLTHRATASQSRSYLRGYYWANLLTAGHLSRLGPLHSSADLVVEELPAGTLVRSAHPITAFDDERLAAMKQLLGPALLPVGRPVYRGHPLRVIG